MHVESYERRWMGMTLAALVLMFLAVIGSVFGAGIRVPGVYGQVDPQALSTTAPFDRPGVRELGPGRYEATIVAYIWTFSPAEIRLPAGSTVGFTLTSRDVVHGFRIQDTTINTMVLPGRVAKVSYTFKRPGTYLFFCHEYCGIGHQQMFGRVVVE